MTIGSAADHAEELDLTPDPRILEVLGEIPYQPWQCLAELVDNSFDEFISDPDRDPADPPAIHMTLPKANSVTDAFVSVVDNGRGMTQADLGKGLRAGYSGRMRYGSLGLFGMGFNIATARFKILWPRPSDLNYRIRFAVLAAEMTRFMPSAEIADRPAD